MDSDLEEDTEVDTLILVSLGAGGVRLSRHTDNARARTHTHTHTPLLTLHIPNSDTSPPCAAYSGVPREGEVRIPAPGT